MTRDKVYTGCIALLVGVEGYPMGSTVHVQQKMHGKWHCIAEGKTEYEDLFLDEDNLSRVTPDDEWIVELYEKGMND